MLKLSLGAVVVTLIGGALIAWTHPQEQTMTAERYLILDSDGIPRGNFGVLIDGGVGMMFTDPTGMQRVDVRVDVDGLPRVALMDDQEGIRAEMGLNADGSPHIVLADSSAHPRAALNVGAAGSAQLLFIAGDGETRQAIIGTLEDGRSVLLLADQSGEILYQEPGGFRAGADSTVGQQ